MTEQEDRSARMRSLLSEAKDLIAWFSDLRCRGGTSPEWVAAIECGDDITKTIDSLLSE